MSVFQDDLDIYITRLSETQESKTLICAVYHPVSHGSF